MSLGVGPGLQEMSWGEIFEENLPLSSSLLSGHRAILQHHSWYMSILEALINIFIAFKNVEMRDVIIMRQNI